LHRVKLGEHEAEGEQAEAANSDREVSGSADLSDQLDGNGTSENANAQQHQGVTRHLYGTWASAEAH
jgi:hypothetical protein